MDSSTKWLIYRSIYSKAFFYLLICFNITLEVRSNSFWTNLGYQYYESLHGKLKQLGAREVEVLENATIYNYEGKLVALLVEPLETNADLKTLRGLAKHSYNSIHGYLKADSLGYVSFSLWKEGNNGFKISYPNVPYGYLKKKNTLLGRLKKHLKYTFAPSVTFVRVVSHKLNYAQETQKKYSQKSSVASVLIDVLRGRPPTREEQKRDFNNFEKIDFKLIAGEKVCCLRGTSGLCRQTGYLKKLKDQYASKKSKLESLFDKVEYYQNHVFNEVWYLREILKKENKGEPLSEKERKEKFSYTHKLKCAYQKYEVESLEKELYKYIKKKIDQRGLSGFFTKKTLENFAKDFISVDGIIFPAYIDANGLRMRVGLKPFLNFNQYNGSPLYEEININGKKTMVLNKRDWGDLENKGSFEYIGKVLKRNRAVDTFNLITTVSEALLESVPHSYSLKIKKKGKHYSIYYFNASFDMKRSGKLDRLKEVIKASDGRKDLDIKGNNQHNDWLDYQVSFSNCCGLVCASLVTFLTSNDPLKPIQNIHSVGLRLLLESLLETDKETLEAYMVRSRRRFRIFYNSIREYREDTSASEFLKNLYNYLISSKQLSTKMGRPLKKSFEDHIPKYKAFLSDKSLFEGNDSNTRTLRGLKKIIDHLYPNVSMDKSFLSVFISVLLI
jgi:hypothetical protein